MNFQCILLQIFCNFYQILATQTGTKYLAKPVDDDDNTPLHFGAIYGHLQIIQTLLETRPKPKVNFLILKKNLPWYDMDINLNILSLQKFWAFGDQEIQLDAKNKRLETPLQLAVKNGHLQ